jgi:hypothetical protein
MARMLQDWLTTYSKYASVTEAPRRMHFWAGVSALAGALRRRVWIDMKRYSVLTNFYTVFVAPPGIVAKSTTADIAMNLLKQVPGIKFGPDIITWPALATAFAASSESFQLNGDWYPMSAMTLVASELGNLINPQDRDMVNLYINLWDGRKSLEKVTKMAGCDTIEAPWINMIACTTPHWVTDNIPRAMVGGGLSSRFLIIYADKKETYVPFVDEVVGEDDEAVAQALVHDLEHVAVNLAGPMQFTSAARTWERARYKAFWEAAALRTDSSTLEGYAARKQTHLFKTAMILSVSRSDSLIIEQEDLELAEAMLLDIEPDIEKVFNGVGRSEDSLQVERLLGFIRRKGSVRYDEAYQQVHTYFLDSKAYEGVLAGLIRANYVRLESRADGMYLTAAKNGAASPKLSIDTEFK